MSESDMASMDTELLSIDNVRPYHRNPREHSQSVEHVQNSIETFGFRIPIVVDGDNTIVAGHGRFKAVQRLHGELDDRIAELEAEGRDDLARNLSLVNEGKILATRDTELDSSTISEFRIVDNRISELSDWNEDLLQSELQRLDGAVGFTDEELDDMLDDFELEIEEDEEDDGPSFSLPDTGSTGVELRCPHCLDGFEVSAEQVKLELQMMADDDTDTEDADE